MIRRTLATVCLVALTAPQTPVPPPAIEWQAGVGSADITPPPGLSTGGYGPAGNITRGYLTRLRARAIFLRAPEAPRTPLLFVSIEAFASASVFPVEIQKALKQQRGLAIDLSSIIVSATHTHHGPGNYLSAKAYNQLASTIHGFDERLRRHLVERVVSASLRAVDDAQREGKVTLRLLEGRWDRRALRNRSPVTFMLNADAASIMDALGSDVPGAPAACMAARQPSEPEEGWEAEGCPRLRAVNRTVTVLEVVKSGRKRAAMIFAAVHPTVLWPDTPLFSGDVVGVAARLLESTEQEPFAAAFFNGAQGDITTRRTTRDLRDLFEHATYAAFGPSGLRIEVDALACFPAAGKASQWTEIG